MMYNHTKKKYSRLVHYKKKDERGIEGVPELEWELSHHTYTPSIVEPLETPIIVLPHTDRRPEKAWHMAFPTSICHILIFPDLKFQSIIFKDSYYNTGLIY